MKVLKINRKRGEERRKKNNQTQLENLNPRLCGDFLFLKENIKVSTCLINKHLLIQFIT